jgi:integrase
MAREPWQITREMFLSESEVDRLLARTQERVRRGGPGDDAARTDQLILHGLLFSGIRNSEFCRLRVADAVLDRTEPHFVVQGTPREDRQVHIPMSLATLVRQYVTEVRPNYLPAGVSARDQSLPLIVNERGKQYERTGLYRRVVRILADAGLEDRASVQLLRHTYGYLAYKRSGGNLLFVQRQLGHAHPQVTSIYAQFVEEPYALIADAVAQSGNQIPARRRRDGTRKVHSKGR